MPDITPAPKGAREMRVRPVPAVTRAIAILRLLGTQKQGMGVKAIADELGLVPSTALHILRVLVAENFVRVEPDTKRYSLGSGMVSLARNVLGAGGFASLAQPALERIVAQHSITAMGVEVTGPQTMLVMAVARPDQPLQLHADVGSEFPSLTSATGRLVAAFGGYGTAMLRTMFDSMQWDRPPSLEDWLGEVEAAREQGWSSDRDRFKNGITSYAVPIFSTAGRMTHSLVAMGLSAEMQTLDGAELVRTMQREAALISRLMSGT